MRAKLFVAMIVAACGSNNQTLDAGRDGPSLDAPEEAPNITSFVATPSQLPAGIATQVTWMWTYANEPTIPDPTCTIDNGVGAVTRGQATPLTLTAVTTFTLTCTNRQGTAAKQVVVAVPPVAPLIATFTVSPNLVTTNSATQVTWTWTYSNNPSPVPVCTVDFVGVIASGTQSMVTQAQARTYRLRCVNSQGAATALATVSVNECVDATAQCDAHATCADTVDSYTCTCAGGYTGNGDVCSAVVACPATPCDTHATCVANASCVCNPGYVGDGLTCARERFAFVTSTTGNGLLSSWVGAGANTGLAAADAVCAARATAAALPGTYVAWMSDSNNDAYCRVHGLTGKKANMCGLGALPVAAGPWARPNGTPLAPTIDKLLAPTHATFSSNTFNESGVELTLTDRVYTGTDDTGVYVAGATCGDWLGNSAALHGAMGEVSGGGTTWTHNSATDPTCDQLGHLRCMEIGVGPALPPRHPVAKKAFLTSVSGTGDLSSWADAGGLTSINAADAICQARARYAGYLNATVFKAWMSSGTSATNRIFSNGPWARADGVVIAANKAALISGRLTAPLYEQETNAYAAGNLDAGGVYTGTGSTGFATFVYCNVWTNGTNVYTGTVGRFDVLDARWVSYTSTSCTAVQQLYCVEDQ